MQFIGKDGQLVEGIPLSDEQIKIRQQILDFAHEKVCGGTFHSSYDRRINTIKCEDLANFFITTFQMTPLAGTDMDKDIAIERAVNAPQAEPGMLCPAPAA